MPVTQESPTTLLDGPAWPSGPTPQALIEQARRRQRRRWTVVAVVILVVALAAGSLLAGLSSGGGRPTGVAAGGAGLFPHPTGDVLVFADGLRLDLDHRLALRLPIAGQRDGDQRWDIVRAGNSLVVGWGTVRATAIADDRSRLLGPVVTFVPAAEADRVWLVDYPGGRIGLGRPTLREVTMSGATVSVEPGPPPGQGVPAVGIPGGLAFETASGVALWSAKAHAFTRHLGTTAGFVGDDAGATLAWCQGQCTSLHVTLVNGPDHLFPSPQAGRSYVIDSARLSPDGRSVAAVTTRPGLEGGDQQGTLDVIDTATGRTTVVDRHLSAYSPLTWTANGQNLFFVSARTGGGMTIGDFSARSGTTETAAVAVADIEQFVILPGTETGAFPVRLGGAQRFSF